MLVVCGFDVDLVSLLVSSDLCGLLFCCDGLLMVVMYSGLVVLLDCELYIVGCWLCEVDMLVDNLVEGLDGSVWLVVNGCLERCELCSVCLLVSWLLEGGWVYWLLVLLNEVGGEVWVGM